MESLPHAAPPAKRKEKIKVHKSSVSHWDTVISGLSITSTKFFSQ